MSVYLQREYELCDCHNLIDTAKTRISSLRQGDGIAEIFTKATTFYAQHNNENLDLRELFIRPKGIRKDEMESTF